LTLGEFGFTGILFLLGLLLTNILRNERIIAKANKSAVSIDNGGRQLIITMQASLISFAVGGAFLSGLYYPHIFIVSALNECVCLLALRGAENQAHTAEKILDIRQQTAVDQPIPIKSPS
jgi:cell division protein FtsW (lipid II flippase)